MADLVWYRSIYWRIALGFVALVATLLVLQILVFLWISGRMDDLFPNRTPAQFAGTIATDLSAGLVDQPTLDVDAFVNSRYSGASRGFAVVFRRRPCSPVSHDRAFSRTLIQIVARVAGFAVAARTETTGRSSVRVDRAGPEVREVWPWSLRSST